jgi:hypothetical protein
MQRMGVPRSVVDCLFTTLQNAFHHVRTGFGDSRGSYGGPVWLLPIHGIGQGNGAGPAIWAVVSTPLLNILHELGFGFEYATPISSIPIRFSGFAFIDDTDLIQMLHAQSSLEEVKSKLQDRQMGGSSLHYWGSYRSRENLLVFNRFLLARQGMALLL